MVGAAVTVAIALSTTGVRLARTTSDLFVASRAISTWWNAAAISGEYLSAASFLGIAGLALQEGVVALWQGVGFAAGYLALLLFVAAPLRRYGSYTIADFAESRVASAGMRVLSSVVVLGITGFYLVAQLKGAGIALQEVTSAPYWVGVATVGVLVALGVALGGMRGITYVQAFQFWLKLTAIAIPAVLLLVHLGGLPRSPDVFGPATPHAPAAGLVVKLDQPVRVRFPAAMSYRLNGTLRHAASGERETLPAGALRLSGGSPLPVANGVTLTSGSSWSRPVGTQAASPIFVYSLLIATFLGTMGLPHILVRFYTNPDGPAARRTTVNVLALIGLFYLFPGVYALLGRAFLPGLYVTGQTDTVVLRVPQAVWPGLPGAVLGGLVAAGAFAAFTSTSSGLLVSIAGTLSHDLWPRLVGQRSPAPGRHARRRFRLAAAIGIVPPAAIALAAAGVDISVLVGWAFALAASTFCPLFLLGIWWRGLTAPGAAAGIVCGGAVATGGIFLDLTTHTANPTLAALLAQPAIVSVPIAFCVMIAVSLSTRSRLVAADQHWLALHAPEELGLEHVLAQPAAVRAPAP